MQTQTQIRQIIACAGLAVWACCVWTPLSWVLMLSPMPTQTQTQTPSQAWTCGRIPGWGLTAVEPRWNLTSWESYSTVADCETRAPLVAATWWDPTYRVAVTSWSVPALNFVWVVHALLWGAFGLPISVVMGAAVTPPNAVHFVVVTSFVASVAGVCAVVALHLRDAQSVVTDAVVFQNQTFGAALMPYMTCACLDGANCDCLGDTGWLPRRTLICVSLLSVIVGVSGQHIDLCNRIRECGRARKCGRVDQLLQFCRRGVDLARVHLVENVGHIQRRCHEWWRNQRRGYHRWTERSHCPPEGRDG